MKEAKDIIQEIVTTVYKNPKDIKMTGMSDDEGNFLPVSSIHMAKQAEQSQLEPMYYWFLDFMKQMGLKVEKIVDNFMSSPGSGHFAEMGQRATLMQDKGMQIFGALNQTIKSALNLVYDLREFKTRLQHYKDYENKKDKKIREAGLLALKQIWLDSVDLPKRGTGSIHQLAATQGGGYTTLREAFMVARSHDDLKRMASKEEGIINEQVARILKPRLQEFFTWIDFSKSELEKRYNIEKSYLKSQVSTIKLYAAWIKPYLKAAEELRQQGFDGNASLVNAFSTSMFQLTLMATPKKGEKTKHKEYMPVLLVNFEYRGHLLQKVNQRGDFAPQFGGRADISFNSYALSNQELDLLRKQLDDQNLKDSLSFESEYAADSILELEKDFEEFLGEEETNKLLKKEQPKKQKSNPDDINPFAVLFSPFFQSLSGRKLKKGEKVEDIKQIKKDNWAEKQARIKAAQDAAGMLYTVYDIYKKAHGMASSPEDFDNQTTLDEPSTYFSDVWRFDAQ